MDQQTLTAFARSIEGDVLSPDHEAYPALAGTFNRQGHPAIIVQVTSHADIAAAIRFALDNHLRLSVRSGGHGLSGLATNEGGLVIDLSRFNTVEIMDSASHLVRVGAGAQWGDVADTLAAHGLGISSGDTRSVGVGGLTLGGGIGWLVRRHGLTIDNLVAAELVTADGQTLRASAEEHPDLFWAIRGGGGNFGVITAFDFHAHPVTTVISGTITYDVAEAAPVLKQWAAAMRTAPEELNATLVVFPGFNPEFPPQVMVLVCYGDSDEAVANEAIRPLLALGDVKSQDIQAKPYHAMLEEARTPEGLRMVSESGYIKTINDEVVAAITDNHGRPGTPIIQIRSLGGAVARIDPQATAYAWRDAEAVFWSVALAPADSTPEQIEHIRQTAWQALKPLTVGAYVNFLSDTSEPSVASAYPPETYARLASVKAAYDPANVFNQNHNIMPREAQPEAQAS